MSWETLQDMLQAQNRSNWIAVLQNNQQAREELMRDPNQIGQLCDNTQNIQKWISQQAPVQRGLNLMQHFQSTDRKLFLVG